MKKIILLSLILFKCLFSQDINNVLINDSDYQKILDSKVIKTELDLDLAINQILQLEVDSSRFLSKITIQNIYFISKNNINDLYVDLKLIKSDKYIVDSLYFKGIFPTRSKILFLETGLRKGEKLSRISLESAINSLSKSKLVSSIQGFSFSKDSTNKYLVFLLENKQKKSAQIVLAYSPSTDDKGSSSAIDATINLENINGSGRDLYLLWKKTDKSQEEIKLNYTEVYIFNYLWHQEFSIHKNFVDSIFTRWSYGTLAEFPITNFFSISLAYTLSSIYPAIGTSNLNRDENESKLSLKYDSKNRKLNGQSGLKTELSIGLNTINNQIDLNNNNTSYSQLKLAYSGLYYIPLTEEQILFTELTYSKLITNKIYETDYFRFGGFSKGRGFRENQFKSTEIAKISFEYRFLLDEKSRLFIFIDNLYFRTLEKFDLKSSYGFGIRQDSPLGILAFDFALEVGKVFEQGIIHIGIVKDLD